MTLDVILNKFSFCFTSKYKAIWKENLVVNQRSLGFFFHTPLQLCKQFVGHTKSSSKGVRDQ